jgi:hypothetical protein
MGMNPSPSLTIYVVQLGTSNMAASKVPPSLLFTNVFMYNCIMIKLRGDGNLSNSHPLSMSVTCHLVRNCVTSALGTVSLSNLRIKTQSEVCRASGCPEGLLQWSSYIQPSSFRSLPSHSSWWSVDATWRLQLIQIHFQSFMKEISYIT